MGAGTGVGAGAGAGAGSGAGAGAREGVPGTCAARPWLGFILDGPLSSDILSNHSLKGVVD